MIQTEWQGYSHKHLDGRVLAVVFLSFPMQMHHKKCDGTGSGELKTA